ncbi:MAG: hypothetical protein IPH63_05305 [Flavobacteriales bacterium]|nr:hypothetical protein [Flavobacteriales bacterium]
MVEQLYLRWNTDPVCDRSVNLIVTTDDNGAETSWPLRFQREVALRYAKRGPYVGVDEFRDG